MILLNVIPNGWTKIEDEAAIILGQVLSWYVFTPKGEQDLPDNANQRCLCSNQQYVGRGHKLSRKVPIVVTGHEGEVYINEIADGMQNGHNNNQGGPGAIGGGAFVDCWITEHLLGMHSQLLGLCSSDEEFCQQLIELSIQSTQQYQTLNAHVWHIAGNLLHQIATAARNDRTQLCAPGNQQGGSVVGLSATPQDLYTLWQEYQVGLGCRKPAQLFSAFEQGQAKHKYTCLKVMWETIYCVVQSGLNANMAIDQIYN